MDHPKLQKSDKGHQHRVSESLTKVMTFFFLIYKNLKVQQIQTKGWNTCVVYDVVLEDVELQDEIKKFKETRN